MKEGGERGMGSGMERESMSNGTVERGGNTIKWCYQTCPHEKQKEDSNMGYSILEALRMRGWGRRGGGGGKRRLRYSSP